MQDSASSAQADPLPGNPAAAQLRAIRCVAEVCATFPWPGLRRTPGCTIPLVSAGKR